VIFLALNLEALLKNLDKEKLQKLLSNPELQEKAKNVDLGKLLDEIKKNPNIANELKKFF